MLWFCSFYGHDGHLENCVALSCHWTDFQKQYAKMTTRHLTITYHKGSFGHQFFIFWFYGLISSNLLRAYEFTTPPLPSSQFWKSQGHTWSHNHSTLTHTQQTSTFCTHSQPAHTSLTSGSNIYLPKFWSAICLTLSNCFLQSFFDIFTHFWNAYITKF